MSDRYPGGIIRDTPPTITPPVDGEGGSAPGVWTLEQASYYTEQGVWPLPTAVKYPYGFGLNTAGQLGLNDRVNRSSPTQLGSDSDWALISSGSTCTGAVKTDGTLWAWGANGYGALGHDDQIDRSSPVQVGALTNWESVSAGYTGMLAIKTNGTLWSWGYNGYGQVGDGTTINRSSPVQIGSDTNWSHPSKGIFACAVIKTNGTLWTWGAGQGSEAILGLNTSSGYRSSPTQVGGDTNWSLVQLSQYATAALKTDGTIWAWGKNQNGEVGDGTTISRSSPVQIGGLTTWTNIKTNGYSSSMACRNDGTLWVWGSSDGGLLGNNLTTGNQSSPIQVGTDTNWSSEIYMFYNQGAAAKKTDGTLWTWGINSYGRLGLGDIDDRSSPTQVGSETTWKKLPFSAVSNFIIATKAS